jgi:energy-coupling factor transport system ATP-binding protein
VALAAGAASVAWLAVLVVLNLTTQPLVAAAAFAGLAVLSWTTPGCRRLLLVAAAIGVGMCVAIPGVGMADGSLRLAFSSGTWVRPHGGEQWIAALATTLRVPAQVLAVALIARVPASLLLGAVARISNRGALLAALAARLGPLLRRDVILVREEMAARGVRLDRGAGLGARLRGAATMWDALVTGIFDRAFVTAAALRTRGYGAVARPTTEPLDDPALRTDAVPARAISIAVGACALAAVLVAVIARHTGELNAPTFAIFGGATEPSTPSALLLAALIVLVGVLPVIGRAPRTGVRHAQRSVEGATPASVAELVLEGVSVVHVGAAAPAIRDVSLRVAPGELVVIIGASGSGKSTLLDAITGIAPAVTGGERRGVIRLGELVLGTAASTAGRVGAVFQIPEAQLIVGSVAEEIAFGLRHAGLAIGAIEGRIRGALDTMGIAHLGQRDCATLSGGELQRVLLAAALALRPHVLVLDEPTSQLDAASAGAFWGGVDAARRHHGMSVIVAEHRLQHVLVHADRVLAMIDGRLEPVERDALAHDATWGDMHPPRTNYASVRLDVRLQRLTVGSSVPTSVQRELHVVVPAGAIVTVEGRNGTGKSTLLRTIRGLQPAHGAVRIEGVDRGAVASSVALFGWMSQGIGSYLPGATVLDAACLLGDRLGRDRARATTAVVSAGFADRLDEHPATLSVGERQRLAFIASTSHGAPIWLLDEPTRGMDAGARRWLATHLYEHARHGGVAVVATHDPAFAAAVATHRLLLDAHTGPHLVEVPRDAAGRPLADSRAVLGIDAPEVTS